MMGDWNLLGGILEEVHIHSTIVGKIWLTILFIFRMLVLGVAAEDVWDDEQAEFVCNTDQPGCRTVCYDRAFPISLIRFWVLQVIFVSAPSLVYMGHALYRIRALEKDRRRRKVQLREELGWTEPTQEEHRRIERELKKLEEQKRVRKAPLRGSLLRTYVIHILTRSALEVGFIMGQYLLYGVRLEPLYKCERLPCPNSVDCYISRPTEKTVFMVFMTGIAGVSLFLNIMEISHLGVKKIARTLKGKVWAEGDATVARKPSQPHGRPSCNVATAVFEKIPEDEIKVPRISNAGLLTGREVQSQDSLAPAGHYLPNCISVQPRQHQLMPQRPSHIIPSQSLEHQENYSATTYLSDLTPHHPTWVETPPIRETRPRPRVYEDRHLPERYKSSTSSIAHRPSLAIRDLEEEDEDEEEEEERRGSMFRDFQFHTPRKTSFMGGMMSSERMERICGSSSSAGSDLGSLGKLDMSVLPPPGGRRMSMSVFLDISSIMKK